MQSLAGGLERTPEDLIAADLELWLPSRPDAPHASPEYPGEGGATEGAELRTWRVPALLCGAKAGLDLLLAAPGDEGRSLVEGASSAFFGQVARLALELIARGRLLPALAEHDGGFAARWRPVLGEGDGRRLTLLSRSMPPACLAAYSDEGPGEPRAVTGAVLEAFVDAAARAGLEPPPGGAAILASRGRPPAAAAWLAALCGDDARVAGDRGELQGLRDGLAAWRSAGLPPSAPVRTCFRVVPPNGVSDAQSWRVEFMLQDRDDPSLLVPAADVWRGRGRLSAFARVIEHPQEKLLEDLGRASRLSPDLEPALQVARPVHLDLDVQGAHRFLKSSVPLLAQAGFGVLVPPWWQAAPTRLGARLRARPRATSAATTTGLLGLEGICDYSWEVALGDQTLSLDELRGLAELKVPLVQVRGQWVEIRPQDVARAVAYLERQELAGPGEATATELIRVALDPMPAGVGLPLAGVEAEGWLADLLAGTVERRLEPVRTPDGFGGSLRPYQERGLAWLGFLNTLGLGACLADDMGLGKTVQLLALLVAERGGEERPAPTLLVCPMSLVGNWQREAERFAPSLRALIHHGSERLSGPSFAEAVASRDLVLTTYALAARDRELLAGIDWGRIVLDEAQNVKNAASQQAQAVRSLQAPGRVALTGTPVENRLSELWSIMDFLNAGLLGSASDFRRRIAVPIERYHDEAAAAQLKRLTQPFILRRLKTDRSIITDLPDKEEMKVYCNITREQATLYQAVLDEMLAKIDASEEDIERRGLVLATMMKLKQVLNHPRHFLRDGSRLDRRSGKLARTEEILDEVVAEGDRALVFTQFAEWGAMLREHLAERLGREVLFLHGGTAMRARDEMVARFQTGSGPAVFVLSLKAGGTGLNLTAANHVIHFDRWWNPAVEDQATDRAFRIGQRKGVQVRKLICIGTLEERIDQMIDQKRQLAERIVGSGEGWLTELSTAELREVVRLSRDAVSES